MRPDDSLSTVEADAATTKRGMDRSLTNTEQKIWGTVKPAGSPIVVVPPKYSSKRSVIQPRIGGTPIACIPFC